MIRPRKCKVCGKVINLIKERENCLFVRGGYYHTQCFIDKKKAMKSPWSDEELGAFLPTAQAEAKEKIDSLIAAEEEIANKKRLAKVENDKRVAFFDFIRDTYYPAIVPGKFYAKLQRYIYGTDKSYKSAIPAEHLHYMWKKLLPKMNEIDAWNRAHNKVIENRWDYDLSIVLNRYPKYLEWLKKQEEKQQAILDAAAISESKSLPQAPVVNHTQEENELDIASMLDEI